MSLIPSLLMTVITVKAFHYHNHYYSTNNRLTVTTERARARIIRGSCNTFVDIHFYECGKDSD